MLYTVFRDGERWKKLRSAIGKQATPRNVNAYAPAFNRIFQGFSDYIRKNRNADNVLADISAPMKLLFVQCKHFGANNYRPWQSKTFLAHVNITRVK